MGQLNSLSIHDCSEWNWKICMWTLERFKRGQQFYILAANEGKSKTDSVFKGNV